MINKKIILSTLLAASMMLSLNPANTYTVMADDTVNSSIIDNFEYEISGENVKIVSYKGSSSSVSIPSNISGYNVTEIGSRAFKKNKKLKELTIPSKVKKIGKSAFEGCSKLKKVTFSKKVKSIKANAFSGNDNLETVFYSGSEDDWDKISIADGNDDLTGADINYNNSTGKKLKYPKTKDDFSVSYTSKLTYSGRDPEMEDFGKIKVTFNNETYTVTDIKINKDIKKFQIKELDNADDKIESAVKSLTKGDNGMSYKIKAYKVTAEDNVSVKMKSKKVKSVKVLLEDDYVKLNEDEYDYDKSSKKLTFKGDRFKGSYKIQDEDIE
ncbi:MAG: leucine-rich repeat domain-containing protein [Lachnospiraceae bacterium]|nr:leucine-rich repeat domain-containing protein [Lachnospiraceae bacterium]